MSFRIESSAEPVAGYRLIERLGSGGFGEVWKAEAPGGIFKAIKIIHGDLRDRDTDSFRFAEQELKALKRVKQVRHPYLLAIDRYDIVDGRLFITMELADCNLWDRFRVCRREGLPGIPRDELMRYMFECAEVLDLFNDKFQLQHLDIKPQNLFLLYDHVKVADFGQVKDLENHIAEVTGGITPVYAAPETFDGYVSRYCDQYSLACVYQELLTGQRPFDGSSMQQLLMQHIQLPPNLQPSPPSDRPALAKALAKKPDDRFPSVKAMCEALVNGHIGRVGISVNTPASFGTPGSTSVVKDFSKPAADDTSASARIEVQLEPANLTQTAYPDGASSYAASGNAFEQSTNSLGLTGFIPKFQTPHTSDPTETTAPAVRVAPPERHGDGSLRPTLILGLGDAGRRVVSRFRRTIGDQFGTQEKLPAVRTLYLDTDADGLAAAAADLPPEDILPVKLNRSAHYLKPRLNGRTILEGWFDPQLLYKLPRNPATMSLRSFGRLAFCDHYRNIGAKLFADLEAMLQPTALADTQANTGLEAASNRPRVVIVAGLGGGTGSGMFLDAAYTVRTQLRRLGYTNPEIVGVFFTPPDHPQSDVTALCRANTYAALTELHHYFRPDVAFTAWYDERSAGIRETEPPFSKVYLLNGPNSAPLAPPSTAAGGSGSTPIGYVHRTPPSGVRRNSGTSRMAATVRRSGGVAVEQTSRADHLEAHDPYSAAADYLRIALFTQAGPLLDEVRPPQTDPELGTFVQTVGLTRFTWPRAEVIRRTGRILAGVLVQHWVSPDPTQVRQLIPTSAQEHWTRLGLEPERMAADLLARAEQQTGVNLSRLIQLGTEQLLPKGWLARTPEPEKLGTVLESWVALIGRPNGPIGREAVLTEAFADAADERSEQIRIEFADLFPQLIESPQFRLAGAEETIRQVLGILERSRSRYEQFAATSESEAASSIDLLQGHVYHNRGMRKLTTSEFTDAVRAFPKSQQNFLLARGVLRVYRKLKDVLTAILAEVASCRQRIEIGMPDLAADSDLAAAPTGPGEYLPAGCGCTEDAVQLFLKSLGDEDLTNLDYRVQDGIEHKFGGLYQACLNSSEGHAAIFAVVKEQTRSYLEDRLGDVDLAGILFHHFQGKRNAAGRLQQAFDQAGPRLVGNGPWTHHALNVYLGPTGPGGDPIREIAAELLPDGTIDVVAPDEVVLCREFPEVPLAALPQFGQQWINAYKAFPESQQSTPHSRLDVTRWTDIDTA